MGSKLVYEHPSNCTIPVEIAENFEELFPEHNELSFEEILLAQESVYESLKKNDNGLGQVSKENAESSQLRSSESQLDLDEAIARSLELEEPLDNLSISEPTRASAGSSNEAGSSTSAETHVLVVHQGSTDPDNMAYEELLALGDTVGTESKGLSEDLIARLPTSKHKRSIFSKKNRHAECVICQNEYKNRDELTTLPCMHMYHTKCITRWLRQSKVSYIPFVIITKKKKKKKRNFHSSFSRLLWLSVLGVVASSHES
ncbi:E3 ubiquitin ligase BIG BROTHER-related-like isoform X2 [Malania oleifera]|uniref:E3 ubiquitin ligase BIG BROTHER-related-like isoform X2 n=1 Tax=Malania oleifera TaxID=397392 RepID=UPI0025ADBCA2|nr:E3 ubiquitin ligase BIG BROTHER-related-like isoform X2 [Malania oleifera]XP_057950592.1 E3 ubiquitin ligase BIG BROTHER-related-like isoform X2 [Malania oleifera]XP_057950593.1 E3 ubiquitin ligase BIG BROTHER-related-like isoform X2 [Malania oleifera]XP_057950594.1 E3 ubiquitin ligase BIG BROTHER-related-like isoform X2 [Malania oleifera]